MMTEELLHLLF